MTEITATAVMALRQRSGAPMMACKKALQACDGDLEQAVVLLRKQGAAASAKKAGRVTGDGLIAQAFQPDRKKAVMIEINAETDFVARNALFQNFVAEVATCALTWEIGAGQQPLTPFVAMKLGNGATIGEALPALIAKIGENISLNRIVAVVSETGCVGGYVHNAAAPGLGRLGALVAVEGGARQQVADRLAMHVAAGKPAFINVEAVPETILDTEREIALSQAKAAGKPAAVLDKIVAGRIARYLGENVLTEQNFVMDETKKVKTLAAEAGIELSAMSLFILGGQ